MGFDRAISFYATKIYLNDIHQAINYCSKESNQSMIKLNLKEVNIEDTSNYNKCYKMLQKNYPSYCKLFEQWFNDEEFEDIQLIDEFTEDINTFKESFFIQYLQENLSENEFSDYTAKQLFKNLYNAISSNDNDDDENEIEFKNNSSSSSNTSSLVSTPTDIYTYPLMQTNGKYSSYEALLIDGYIRDISKYLKRLWINKIPQDICSICYAYYPKNDDCMYILCM